MQTITGWDPLLPLFKLYNLVHLDVQFSYLGESSTMKKDKLKSKRILLLGPLFLLFVPSLTLSSLFAQKADDPDKKISSLSKLDNYELKIDGLIYSGFEFLDRQGGKGANEHGLDDAGPDKQKQGFRISRAYINVKGKVKDGNYEGWNFRVTTDLSPAGEQGDGCKSDGNDTCDSGDNDYNVHIKYAYLSIPLRFLDYVLGASNSIRLGQQHSPLVDAKSGVSLQSFWGHRYLAKTTADDVALSSSADRGLAFIYKGSIFGAHLLFGNGEGYHHNNAEGINITESTLGTGDTPSYGYDLYGVFSLAPLGTEGDHVLAVSIPFRFKNFYGVTDEELVLDDARTGGTGALLQGDKKAKQDVIYGWELGYKGKTGRLFFTVGAGSYFLYDYRSNVLNARTGSTVAENEDAKGFAHHGFIHLRWQWLGLVGRYIYGSAGDSPKLDGKVRAADSSKDEVKGDGAFHKYVYALTFFPSNKDDFFKITIGREQLRGRKDSSQRIAGANNLVTDDQTFIRTQIRY